MPPHTSARDNDSDTYARFASHPSDNDSARSRRRRTRALLLCGVSIVSVLATIPVILWLSNALSPATTALDNTATSSLAIFSPALSHEEQQRRAAEIKALASKIANEKRTWRIGGINYPFYDGPVPRPGSLAAQIQDADIAQLNGFKNPHSMELYALALQSPFETLSDYTAFYDRVASKFAPRPTSTDISDESFGSQRTTTKGFRLRAFRPETDAWPHDASLDVAANVARLCGRNDSSVASLAQAKRLFVSDFSTLGQWNSESSESTNSRKYVASVVAYFCYHADAQQLRPLAIRVVDTNITYTPFDRPAEWTLAKMAVEAAETTDQQMQHLVDTHAVFVPLRVEVLRTLAPTHPVRALLLRALRLDLGIEKLAAELLLNTSTPLDLTFGLGAVGCTRLFAHQLAQLSMRHDFLHDVATRGVDRLPIHKYAAYGRRYYDAIAAMVGAYLRAYYPSDRAVEDDVEIQNWAAASASIGHLRDFPPRFETVQSLQTLLTHVLFQAFVRHHAMNGAVSWDSVSVPFSTPALWQRLPTHKLRDNETLDVLAYSIPKTQLPLLVTLALTFRRDVPGSEALGSLFQAPVFTNESRLSAVARSFELALASIDELIVATELHESRPYHVLRPSVLARYGWI